MIDHAFGNAPEDPQLRLEHFRKMELDILYEIECLEEEMKGSKGSLNEVHCFALIKKLKEILGVS